MHIGYWWGSQKKNGHLEDQGIGGWTILKWIVDENFCSAVTLLYFAFCD
jgi:hypothetical protein